MRVIALAKEEIVLLSIIYGKKYNSYSVMNGLNTYKDLESIVTKEQYVRITEKFVKDALLGFDPEKKLRPTRETILLFDTINAPQKTMKINNQTKPEVGTIYYSEKNGFGVLITISPDSKYCMINYPFNQDVLGEWLSQEVIGNLEVEKEEFLEQSYELSQGAYVQFMAMVSYNNDVIKNAEDHSNIIFKVEQLKEIEFLESTSYFDSIGVSKNGIKELMTGEEGERLFQEIVEKKLVFNLGDGYRLNHRIAKILDTAQFRSIVRFQEESPLARTKNLYATNAGYLIMEEVKYDPATVKLTSCPLTITPKVLIEKIVTFSDVRISDEMKKQLEAKINKE